VEREADVAVVARKILRTTSKCTPSRLKINNNNNNNNNNSALRLPGSSRWCPNRVRPAVVQVGQTCRKKASQEMTNLLVFKILLVATLIISMM
jgi:hypothetical protein